MYISAKNADNCEYSLLIDSNFCQSQTFNRTLQNKDILKNPQIFEDSLISWEWNLIFNFKVVFIGN